jgi:hypothetical protein
MRWPSEISVLRLAPGLALTALLCAWPAGAGYNDFESLDLLQIQFVGRDLYAINADGSTLPERLENGEAVLWRRALGGVGVVLTDRRMLAASTDSSRWQSERFLQFERPHQRALLDERVAILLTDKRVLSLDCVYGTLAIERLSPNKRVVATELAEAVAVVATELAEAVAVVATNRRALGTAPRLRGFVAKNLTPREVPLSMSATGNLATVLTARRLLTFRGSAGAWGERRRKIH